MAALLDSRWLEAVSQVGDNDPRSTRFFVCLANSVPKGQSASCPEDAAAEPKVEVLIDLPLVDQVHFKADVAAVLKVNPYFVKDYETSAALYNVSKTVQIISLLRTFDMKSKGYGDPGTEPGDLLKELVFRILHL